MIAVKGGCSDFRKAARLGHQDAKDALKDKGYECDS